MSSFLFSQLLGSLFSESFICSLQLTAMIRRWNGDERAMKSDWVGNPLLH